MALKTLLLMAQRLGMTGRGVRLEPPALPDCAPAVLHWDMDHFVVLKEVRGGHAHDPAMGVRRCDLGELGRRFTGIVSSDADRGVQRKKSAAWDWASCAAIAGFWTAMTRALSFCGSLQLAVDEGVGVALGALTALAIGFGSSGVTSARSCRALGRRGQSPISSPKDWSPAWSTG